MTNGQINFVHDLVQMAKAFEELPHVQEELDRANHMIEDYAKQVQRLEMRLIDLKNDLDAAHAATAKVEVERDHAERMFLEADERVSAFRRLMASFQAEAGALVAAAEPEPKPEPEQVTEALTVGAEGVSVPFNPTSPAPATEAVQSPVSAPLSNDAVTETSEAVSVPVDPTPATETSSVNVSNVSTENAVQHEEAPHPVDPIASSTVGDGHSLDNATPIPTAQSPADATLADTSSADDVGYHNEPSINTGDGLTSWQAWDDWCHRMNAKFGPGHWPQRPLAYG